MSVHLDIPESVATSLRLPLPEIEPRLRTELAVALYAQGILSFGKASELAGSTRYEFGNLASQRGIARHYTDVELGQDLDYASGQ
jgi:predicted HTH domain antitoxin